MVSEMIREQGNLHLFMLFFVSVFFCFLFDVVRLRVELRVLFLKLARSKIVSSKILR
jgi:hypothetical protein